MAAKLQYYSDLAEYSAGQLMQSRESWTQFLTTTARLYKYQFDEQLMIFAQRPDATACAPMETWNKPMRRYVKRGSKGIALIDSSGKNQKLRYVFDVSDTEEGRYKSIDSREPRRPYLWEMRSEHEGIVRDVLAKSYGNNIADNFSVALYDVAQRLADEYYETNEHEIEIKTEGSFLENFDGFNKSLSFRDALTVSTAYSVMSRCGLNPDEYFEDEEFQSIFDFNTNDSVHALGTAVSKLSEQVLREIEVTVKKYEREKSVERSTANERNNLHASRGLSDSRSGIEGSVGGTDRQVRQNEKEFSARAPSNIVQFPSVERTVVSASEGDRPNGEPPSGAAHGGITEERPAAGQSDGSDGLGRPHEQPESSGGRNDIDGTDLQLTPFPTEQAQRETIAQAEELIASAFSISDAEIDALLRQTLENSESRQRIVGQFEVNPRSLKAAQRVKEEYSNLEFDMPRVDGQDGYMRLIGVDKGVYISKEYSEKAPLSEMQSTCSLTVPWPKVQQRIMQLVNTGQFLIADPLTQAQVEPQSASLNPAIVNLVADVLMTPEHKEVISSMIAEWKTGTDIADYCSRTFWRHCASGSSWHKHSDDISYGWNKRGLMIDINDTEKTMLRYTWEEIASVCRGLNAQELDGIQTVLSEVVGNMESGQIQPEANTQTGASQSLAHGLPDQVQDNGSPASDVPQSRAQAPVNFSIIDDHLGEGGAKTKYGYNIAAIRTLKQLESEKRLATPAEQEILSRYVGWGGIPQAFDSENDKWTKKSAELRGLLTGDEYEMARASTLNAHYTSPTVIKAIYNTIERMGFEGGNILEPACGIGNFFGLLPESMAQSKLYGVELDSVTGRIAQQLYQNANIRITGFEKTGTPDALFDLAIGNVPFGNYKVSDKRYDKNNFAIHDYFFAKTLDQVRPGGIVAFITSNGTMDKANSSVRKYIAQRAELLGAVRLPNNAFLKNAGTEVTTDIIFLQKRDRLIDIQPDWVHLGVTENGIPVNSYFAEHPEMMLGKMVFDESMYGDAKDTSCHPIPGADLAVQLQEALANIQGRFTESELDDISKPVDVSIPADPDVRNYSYTIVDDKVYFRENSRMNPVDLPDATLERIKGMVELRDTVHTLINYQLDEYADADVIAKQSELNHLYDAFTAKYGLINSTANSRAFSGDSAYYLLCSLEVLDENRGLDHKADIFSKRTIKPKKVVTSVGTASEALAVSIAERAHVDMGFMQNLTGFTEDKLTADLEGVVFRLPDQANENDAPRYVTSDEYLSGNVRKKLNTAREAAKVNDIFLPNVKALEQAQPKDLDASEISVRLGSTWIDKKYVEQFVHELLQPPFYLASSIKVNYSDYTGEWNVTGHRRIPGNNVLANVTYGTSRMNAYRIIEETLNLKDMRVYDNKTVNGKEVRELNKKETTLAQQKQDMVKQAFNDWIFKDPDRRRDLVTIYNERFNSFRPREYDGSHINFSGITPDITLRPHQLNAIAHVLYGGNTLLAHEVGAGKSATRS